MFHGAKVWKRKLPCTSKNTGFLKFHTQSFYKLPRFWEKCFLLCKEKTITFASSPIKEITMRTKSKTEKEENEVVPEERKSKITLYWEKRDRLGYPPGEIINRRAVLK